MKQLIHSYFQVKNQYQPYALILDISEEVFVEKFNTSIAQRQRLYSKPYKTSGNIFNGNLYIKIEEVDSDNSNLCASLTATFKQENDKLFINGRINNDSDGNIAFSRGGIIAIFVIATILLIFDERKTLIEVTGAILFGIILIACYKFYEKIMMKKNAQKSIQYFTNFFLKMSAATVEL
ncbi:MAG: hypothetical protein K1X55_08310 [Chitinophagales bacterium]|nr:hypothetical protein [Chitinophagales bacterium]